jgi:PKD repeat protein
LSAENQHHCFDTANAPLVIYPLPVIQSIDVAPSEGCQPLDVHFQVNATNANHFVWNFGDGTTAITDSSFASHWYPDSGTYSVTLMVSSFSSCGDTILLPDTVTVHVKPTAGFDYLVNETVEPVTGNVTFVNTSLNSNSYAWNFGDGTLSTETNPEHTFPDINTFQVMLVASTPYGCKDTAIKDIRIIMKSLYVPNALAPGFDAGSGLVKLWKPAGMGLLSYHAQIFNTWGELLWESTAITNDDLRMPEEGWDGTYQGKLCDQDVYVWKVEAVFLDGTIWKGMSYKFQERPKTIGDVTLIW